MFYGQYNASVDAKGRLALPRMLRDGIANGEVVLMKGYESTVYGYDKQAWEIEAQVYLKQPLTDEDARVVRRNVFSNAFVAKLDDQGRVVIPQRLLAIVGPLEKVSLVTIIGAGDHFEIWQSKQWEQYKDAIE